MSVPGGKGRRALLISTETCEALPVHPSRVMTPCSVMGCCIQQETRRAGLRLMSGRQDGLLDRARQVECIIPFLHWVVFVLFCFRLGLRSVQSGRNQGARDHATNPHLRHMLIGYARGSKAAGSQPLDLQRDAPCDAGVDSASLYHDLASGTRDDRPGELRMVCAPRERATCWWCGSSTVSGATLRT